MSAPWVDFLMVIMASSIARGRVRTTATESRNMAAILQLIDWQRHVVLDYRVLVWYWSSLLWSIDTCQNKVSAEQYTSLYRGLNPTTHRGHMFFEVNRWPSAVFCGSWFTNSARVLPTSRVVYQSINHRNLWSIAWIIHDGLANY